MQMSSDTAILLAFAWSATALMALAEGLYLARTGQREDARREAARERVRRHATRMRRTEAEDSGSILLESNERGPLLNYITSLIPNRRPLDLWLYRAGAPMQLEVFAGVTVATGLAGYTFGVLVTGSSGYALLFSVLGLIPTFYVRRLKKKRMAAFEGEFPGAIDLLNRSLRAGHPLSTALQLMAEESSDPVSTEMSQVVEEVGMGLDTRLALVNLRNRLGTQDVSYFVNAVLIQRETGGDLPRVLDALAKQSRDRLNFHQKVRALVAQTSMSANLLALFPFFFAVMLSITVPGYLSPMLDSESGRLVLLGAGGLTLFGWLLCRQVAVVKV